jgi:hypothetical protein
MGTADSPRFLKVPGGTSPFFCGLDDPAGLECIPYDKVTDFFGL